MRVWTGASASGAVTVLPMNEVSGIISDAPANQPVLDHLAAAGIPVIGAWETVAAGEGGAEAV